MTSFTRQHAWFGLFVLVVFALGLGTGLVLARFVPPGAGFGRPGLLDPGRPPAPEDMVGRLARDLELTAEQRQKIEAVFANAGARFERFRAASREQFDALRRQMNEEIEQVLTEPQRARFRAMVPERGGPPGPPRGPGGPGDIPPGLPGPPPR